jgi:hypothetical protein
MDRHDVQQSNQELIDKLTNEFGLVIVPTEVPEELTTPWLESFYTAFSKYRTLGLTNFSNIQTGPLHLLINNSGTMMNGQPLFPDKDPRGYAWNSPEYNQLIIKQPIDTSTDILTKEYQQYVAHHEPGHILQYQLFPGFEDFNALSRVLSSPAIQSFQELGYHIVSPSSLFGKKPP